MVLLFAPLAKIPRQESLSVGLPIVLANLTEADSHDVYAAIRAAKPGGLGKVNVADINDDAPPNLLDAMRLAADRDLIARQYVNGFHHVLNIVAPGYRRSNQR